MKRCIIIGKTNAGKTLFAINFASYLGEKNIDINVEYYDGKREIRRYSIENAIKELTGIAPHKTTCLQKVRVNIRVGKGEKTIEIIDTTGLTDTVHQNENIRRAISQTLATIRESQVILHIVDSSAVFNKDALSSLGEVDYSVAQFAQLKTGYAMLANKIDLKEAKRGVEKLKQEFPGNRIIPVSAKYKTGFREVLSFVRKNL